MNEAYPIDFHDLSVKDINKIVSTSLEDNKLTLIIEQNAWLGDVLNFLPHGIVNKNVTGIGATTLELESERDSIIVVPTKALAYGKYKKKTSSYFYLGSPITGTIGQISNEDIDSYIDRKDIFHKFIVVADSLPRLIRAFRRKGIDVFNSHFLMIDEVDIIQSDVTFRPALENTIDYYLKFKEENRCLVSATIREFSHVELQKERLVYIDYPELRKRKMNSFRTNHVNKTTCNCILRLLNTDDSKILVAYNSVTEIHVVIEYLKQANPDISKDIGILCGSTSISASKGYYTELNEGILSHKITFMTCAYFVGIDIEENCHVISVSSEFLPYTLLSPQKLTQIRGRCRKTVLSETFIFNISNDSKNEVDIKAFTNTLLEKASDVVELLSLVDKISDKPSIKVLFDLVKSAIQEKLTARIVNEQAVPLSRKNIDGGYNISFFNIDALAERKELKHNIYTKQGNVVQMLYDNGIEVRCMRVKEEIEEEETIFKKVREEQSLIKLEQLEEFKIIVDSIGNYRTLEQTRGEFSEFIDFEEYSYEMLQNILFNPPPFKESLSPEDIEKFNKVADSLRNQWDLVLKEKQQINSLEFSYRDDQLDKLKDVYKEIVGKTTETRTIKPFFANIFLLRQFYDIKFITEKAKEIETYVNSNQKNNALRALIFHAMDDHFFFKQRIMEEFEMEKCYSPDEIEEKMSQIYSNYPQPIAIPKAKTIKEHFGYFVGTIPAKITIAKGKRKDVRKVLNYNPLNLPEPINKIKSSEQINIYELMMFNKHT